jgi:indolepyruvate ferredoxin oxidoreductase beta subunit
MTSNKSNTNAIVSLAIAGVGGQGVLTLAELLAKVALAESHNVRVGEIHGMAQRGGHVICTVRIGPGAMGPIVDSGTADILVGFEPVETLREIQLIRPGGHVIMSSHVQYPVAVSMGQAEYPDAETIRRSLSKFTDKVMEFDAMELAKRAGSVQSLNIVMMGAILATGLTPLTKDVAIKLVAASFPAKFETVNTAAFNLGYDAVKSGKVLD